VPTKKQRRRRAKEQRHEYVWVDEQGKELDHANASADAKKETAGSASARGGRVPDVPTWRRSVKRGLIFAPIMFATVLLLAPNAPMQAKIGQTLFIVAVFIPFSYFLDRVFYRSYLRRAGKGTQSRGRRGS